MHLFNVSMLILIYALVLIVKHKKHYYYAKNHLILFAFFGSYLILPNKKVYLNKLYHSVLE